MKMIDTNEEIIEKKEEIVDVGLEFWPVNDLPSKYKFYPVGTKIYGRSLTVPEVKKLSRMNEENGSFVVNNILSLAFKGIRIEDLLIVDKFYLILWLRANTYKEPGYEVEYFCKKCNSISCYDFDLDKLIIKYYDESFNNTLTLKNNDKLTIKFSTVSDEMEIEQFKSKINPESIEEFDDLDLASCIDTINGQKLTIEEKHNYLVNKLKPSEYQYLKAYVNKYEFGVRQELTAKCKKCGGESLVGVTFRREFFLPEYRFRDFA